MSENRVFYSLQERVGGSGCYQFIALVIWSAILLVSGASFFFNSFLFYQEQYKCSSPEINCKAYVCSLPSEERTAFILSKSTSLASKFGDYRCDDTNQLQFVQSFIYTGAIFGPILGAFINKHFTLKKILIIASLGNLIGIIIAMTGPTLFIASIGLFINLAASSVHMDIVYCFITCIVSQQIRGKEMMKVYIFEALGITLNGLFYYCFQWKWELFLLFYIFFPALFGFFGLIFFIQETSFDLVTNFSPEYSLEVFQRIAKVNSRQNQHKITLEELQNIKEQYMKNEAEKHDYTFSIIDLFRYNSLRFFTILNILLHFVIWFQFSIPEIALKDYSQNMYVNGIIIGSSQVFGSIVCYFTVDHYLRKKSVFLSEFSSIAICVPLLVFLTCIHPQDCSMTMKYLQTLGIFLYRLCITVTYTFFYMIQYQTYPAQILGLAIQVTSISSYLAIVFLPMIMKYFERQGISIIFTFAISSILTILMMIKVPQTFGVLPPEIIEELKYEHKGLKHEQNIQKIKDN